ncbi:peptidylprolyl isomerase [Roseomonas sp. CECT 9278]|uniref:peptidylprolyl isomerase n=1 Tax=Roseomonas sp. CECT 9278 TaxID=2845823 RepID=UPI001E2F855D|nr:peptidylprolyl isomerase [Roseomonas sp. CECT 9278]CAH0269977.1 Peptidyl-prolyl cis-trans isomerase D [Roseomonas sp. CECT 9278]
MLTALRRLAGTWVAKILFALLVLSFAVWGIEDVVRNIGRDTAVAHVGGDPIELTEAQANARREMARIARQMGARFEPDDNIRRAVAAQALEQLISDRALRTEARRQGIGAPADAVRNSVFAIPGLRGADGTFSRPIFDSFLRQNELNEQQFLQVVAGDLLRQQLAGAVRSGALGPDAMSAPLLAWAMERRSAEVVAVNTAAMPDPEPPTEAQLRRYQENNPARFSTPEYREAAIAVLSPEGVAAEIEVPDADLAQAYEQRRAQYDTPERRALRQAVVPTEAAAREIATAWRGGAEFPAIEAAATAADGSAADLGLLDRATLPLANVAQAAFAAADGAVTDPVQSPFGWHVIKVDRIEPAAIRTLADVRDELRAEVARDRALDMAYERANRVEDALAGGTPLAEVAQRLGLALVTATMDSAGRDPANAVVALPVPDAQRADLLRAVFAARQGDAPRMTEMGDAFVAVELRAITPPALRPFESIEGSLQAAFIADARRRAAEERAAALLAAVRGGKPLQEAAEEAGLIVQRAGPFGRTPQQANTLPPELLAPLFEARQGDVTMAETRTGFAVARLTEIIPFNPATDPLGMGRIRTEIEQSMQDELEEQYAQALRGRADVRINRTLLDQVTGR